MQSFIQGSLCLKLSWNFLFVFKTSLAFFRQFYININFNVESSAGILPKSSLFALDLLIEMH